MDRSINCLILMTMSLVLAAGGCLDLGDAPFKCNKGSPKCPEGYTCSKYGNCIKKGFCPGNLLECQGGDGGINKDGPVVQPDGAPATCGNGKCDPGETSANCPKDCSSAPVCGNGTCEAGETATSCPQDCSSSAVCGNGKCEPGETSTSCPQDCGSSAVCGNGTCEPGETATSCPQDCGSTGCTDGATQCVNSTTLQYCENSAWKQGTCTSLCVAGGYGYADGCQVSGGKAVCMCGGAFGNPCNDTTKKCGTGLICVTFATNPNLGYCTKECYSTGSICTGAPTGTYAECSFQVTTPTGTKKICGFVCSYSQPCPSGLTCDYTNFTCKP